MAYIRNPQVIQKPQAAEPTSPQGYQRTLALRLTANERAMLRGLAKTLTALCDLIYTIGEDYEERLAEELRRRHHSECADMSRSQEHPSKGVFPTQGDIPSEDGETSPSDPLSIRGERGRSGNNPIDAIMNDLEALTKKIESLCDKGTLQTTSSQLSPDAIPCLSDDGNTREQTGISAETNNVHPQHSDVLRAIEEAKALRSQDNQAAEY